LKFDVGVFFGGFGANRGAKDEVVVFVEGKVGAFVELTTYAVGVDSDGVALGDDLGAEWEIKGRQKGQ
jgi:hypothetical protein